MLTSWADYRFGILASQFWCLEIVMSPSMPLHSTPLGLMGLSICACHMNGVKYVHDMWAGVGMCMTCEWGHNMWVGGGMTCELWVGHDMWVGRTWHVSGRDMTCKGGMTCEWGWVCGSKLSSSPYISPSSTILCTATALQPMQADQLAPEVTCLASKQGEGTT